MFYVAWESYQHLMRLNKGVGLDLGYSVYSLCLHGTLVCSCAIAWTARRALRHTQILAMPPLAPPAVYLSRYDIIQIINNGFHSISAHFQYAVQLGNVFFVLIYLFPCLLLRCCR